MQIGMIGLGRMGANMVRRLLKAVPVPVLSAALYQRFTSRGQADFQDKLLSVMRYGFDGHLEKAAA